MSLKKVNALRMRLAAKVLSSYGGFCLTWLSPRAEPFRHLLVADFLFTVQLGHPGLYHAGPPFFSVDRGGDGLRGKKGLRPL
jgi:hypothetical protein